MSVAADVSEWIAKPEKFSNIKCGYKAVFSEVDNSAVHRRHPEERDGGCVCRTAHPLAVGQVWQATVLATLKKGGDGLVSHLNVWC